MTFDLIIKDAICVLPDNTGKLQESKTDVGVINSKIAEIGSLSSKTALNIINANGLHCLAGIIDSQVHFREPGLTHKEDIESGTRAALLGGVTSVFEMPNTNPSTSTAVDLNDKLARSKNRAWVNYAYFIGAGYDNLDKLHELEILPGCSGIKIFMGSSTGNLLVKDDETLEKILRNGKRRVIVHSEDEYRLAERKHIALEGKDPHLHPVWRDVESALNSTKRLIRLAEKTKRKVHVLHVSTSEEMELLKEYKQISSVEVLPQHLTLFAPDCYDRLGTLAQQNPPIREKRHLEGIWKALQSGVVDIIGSDHAPHTREEKEKVYPNSPSGVPGVQTLVPIMLNHVNDKKLSITHFAKLVCENPRWVFGCKTKGRIAIGLDADFTLIDLKKQRTIENKWIASKCGWTPFDGYKVTGWPIYTIIGGKIAMQDDQIIGSPKGERVDFDF